MIGSCTAVIVVHAPELVCVLPKPSRLDVAHGPPACLDRFIPVQRIPAPVTEPVPVCIQVPQGSRGPDLSQPAETAGQFLLSSPETGPGLQDPGLPPVGTRFLVRLPLKPDAAGHISAAVFLIFLDFCVGNIDGGREHLGDHQGLRLVILPGDKKLLPLLPGSCGNQFHKKAAAFLVSGNHIFRLSGHPLLIQQPGIGFHIQAESPSCTKPRQDSRRPGRCQNSPYSLFFHNTSRIFWLMTPKHCVCSKK